MTVWSKEEITFLQMHYAEARKVDLIANLSNRSWKTIQRRAFRLHLRRSFRYLSYKRTVIPSLSDFQIGYIAGFIDGEGSFMVTKSDSRSVTNYEPLATMTNTNREVMEIISSWLKIGYITEHGKAPQHHKDCYALRIQKAADVWALVDFIEPYLIIKRRQAQLIRELAIIKANKSMGKDYIVRDDKGRVTGTMRRFLPKEQEIYEEVRRLNKRGVS